MFKWKSPMRLALRAIMEERARGRVVWFEEAGVVQAWGLFLWSEGADRPEIMLYTRRAARGRGLAKYVFWGLRNTLERADYIYYPHDKAAEAFYRRMYEMRGAGTILTPEVAWLAQ